MNRLIDYIAGLIATNVQNTRGIRSVYKSDNVFIPEAALPAVTISPEKTIVNTFSSAEDQHTQRVVITVILNAESYLGAEADEAAGLYELTKIMEEEDENGVLKNDTILSVVRKNLSGDGTYTMQCEDIEIDYGFGAAREYPTIEATLSFTAHRKPYFRNI